MAGDKPRTGKRYRSKLEVLRDFLDATRSGEKRTRIIGVANLNVRSFRRYRDFCLDRGLIMSTSGGYALTPEADTCLEAIRGVLTKREELNGLLESLERATMGRSVANSNGTGGKLNPPLPAWLIRSDLLDLNVEREQVSSGAYRTIPPRAPRER